MAEYCKRYILPMGEDIEGPCVQLGILPALLGCECTILFYDRPIEKRSTCTGQPAGFNITILHEPGHYDLLYAACDAEVDLGPIPDAATANPGAISFVFENATDTDSTLPVPSRSDIPGKPVRLASACGIVAISPAPITPNVEEGREFWKETTDNTINGSEECVNAGVDASSSAAGSLNNATQWSSKKSDPLSFQRGISAVDQQAKQQRRGEQEDVPRGVDPQN
jgi:hypothetical protein